MVAHEHLIALYFFLKLLDFSVQHFQLVLLSMADLGGDSLQFVVVENVGAWYRLLFLRILQVLIANFGEKFALLVVEMVFIVFGMLGVQGASSLRCNRLFALDGGFGALSHIAGRVILYVSWCVG